MATSTKRYTDKIFTTANKTTVEYIPGFEADIYTPEGDTVTSRPVVIVMSGGGGSKEDVQNWAEQEWALRGYVGIAANYKDTVGDFNESKQEKAVINVWNLILFIQANTTKYGMNKRKILVMGVSAGGITAIQSSIALDNRNDPYFGTPSPIPSKAKMKILASATISGAASNKYQDMINAGDPPNYAYHGTEDHIVNYKTAVDTYNKMIEVGIKSTLMSFEGADHTIGHGDEIKADLIPKFAALL